MSGVDATEQLVAGCTCCGLPTSSPTRVCGDCTRAGLGGVHVVDPVDVPPSTGNQVGAGGPQLSAHPSVPTDLRNGGTPEGPGSRLVQPRGAAVPGRGDAIAPAGATSADIEVGSTVRYKTSTVPIGTVDAVRETRGIRYAIVSWPTATGRATATVLVDWLRAVGVEAVA